MPVLEPLLCGVLVGSGQLALLAQPTPPLPPSAGLEELVARLVRRAAWGGDGARGTARLELAHGALSGAVLTVHAERRQLTIELELPPERAAGALAARIGERLAQRGFVADVRVSSG